ncbi:MAG: PaaI family thioesterase [Sphingomicrobium sp.]|nr:PaaI family thioesterase [Sphingomonadales bacterium]
MSESPESAAQRWSSFDPVAFLELVRRHGHGATLGIRYQDHGDDWIELALPWREDLVGVPETGVLASGAIVSLIDMAAGMSVWIKLGAFRANATLDLRIDYLRPAKKGETVFARCRCIRSTRSVAFVEGLAHVGDRDDPIARAALTFMPT